jgi:hypothetical protein
VIAEATPAAETFTLTALNLRLLADGHLAVTADRPTVVAAPCLVAVSENPTLTALIADAVESAACADGVHRDEAAASHRFGLLVEDTFVVGPARGGPDGSHDGSPRGDRRTTADNSTGASNDDGR